MQSKTAALGRGLSALLANIDDKPSDSTNLVQVELSALHINHDNQPRKTFDEASLAELAESIKTYGILQPILVKQEDNNLYIIAGERRVRASKIAGLTTIPAIMVQADAKRSAEIALLENIQRENLPPLEEAETYNNLIQKYGYTHETLASTLGKSRSYISNMIRLTKMPADLLQLVKEEQLSVGHARALLTAKDPAALAKKVIDEKLSVRDTEQYAKNKGEYKHSKKSFYKDAEMQEIEEMLTQSLGLKVEITDNGRFNAVSIHFNDLNELDYIIEKLAN